MEQPEQRNILLMLVLFMGMFVVYDIFIAQPQRTAQQQEQRSRAQAAQAATPQQTAPTVQLRTRDAIVQADTAAGSRVLVQAPAIDGSISLNGARIDDVSLKNFYETLPDKEAKNEAGEIQLLSPDGTERAFYATVQWTSEGGFSTDTALWTQTSTGPLTPANPLRLRLEREAATIERTIAIDSDYMFTVTDVLTNTSAAAITLSQSAQVRQRLLPEHTTTPVSETQAHRGALGVYGPERNQQVNYNDLNQNKTVLKSVTGGWNSLTTKYWFAATIPDQQEQVTMAADAQRANGQTMFRAGYTLTPYTIEPGQSVTKTARVFAGAKRVAVLDRYEKEAQIPAFTDAVDWSWLFFITKPCFYLLQVFQSWFGSFGLAILALTVVVKTVFFPLQFNMYKSMSKMRILQPEMKAIQERFAADPQRLRQEQAKLWQREKINPLAGCLPLIPTMFVFYALFHTLAVTIEMRHTPFFGWIRDMSAPDPTSLFNLFGLIPWNPASVPFIGGMLMIGVWPLLYGGTMVLLQGLSAPPQDKMQRAIMRWIPLIFMVMFAGFASGLVIYYVWSNLISVIQQYIIMRRTGVETEFDKFIKNRFGKKSA